MTAIIWVLAGIAMLAVWSWWHYGPTDGDE